MLGGSGQIWLSRSFWRSKRPKTQNRLNFGAFFGRSLKVLSNSVNPWKSSVNPRRRSSNIVCSCSFNWKILPESRTVAFSGSGSLHWGCCQWWKRWYNLDPQDLFQKRSSLTCPEKGSSWKELCAYEEHIPICSITAFVSWLQHTKVRFVMLCHNPEEGLLPWAPTFLGGIPRALHVAGGFICSLFMIWTLCSTEALVPLEKITKPPYENFFRKNNQLKRENYLQTQLICSSRYGLREKRHIFFKKLE